MKETTRDLFIKPLMFQENITIIILVPILVFFFRYISEAIVRNFMTVVIGASLAAAFGLILGTLTKYLLVKPALAISDQETYTPQEMQRAVKSLSLLPLAEAVVIFLRFALFGNLIATLPIYLMGYIGISEFLFGVNSVVMIGLLALPIIYLSSENSLTSFYMKSNLKGVLDTDTSIFRMSLSHKTLATILLIATPPLGLILGLLYLSMATGLKMESLQLGFYVILIETIVLAFVCGFLLMRNMSLSVGKMSVMFQDMAKGQGDLTKRLYITGLNEVGELAFWFNEFMNDIEQIVGHVRGTTMQLHKTIEDVSTGSRGLTHATQEQASSVQEISSSIEEMNATIQNNADLIHEGQESSNAITKLIDHSKQLFSELMSAIQEISLDSRKIGDIVLTVNEVAFHTNLLALNASVEAARAGEHGKGFAVVAGEVRSLAQRSAGAASEIKSLIEGTVGRIKNGDDVMKKTSSSLEELMSRMEFFFRMMEVISSSSMEQKQNITELNRSINQIDGSTQDNATTVHELASALDNLRSVVTVLADDVHKFKTSQGLEAIN